MAIHRPRPNERSDETDFRLRAGDRGDTVRLTGRAVQQEINNSLAILMAQAQLLLVDPKAPGPDTEARRGLEAIYREIQRMAEAMERITAPTGADTRSAPEPVLGGRRGDGETADQAAEFQSLVESMGQGVMVVGPGMIVRYANPSLEAITGYPVEQIVGRQIDTFLDSTSAPEQVKVHLERALSERPDPLEVQLPRGPDRTVWIRLESTPLRPRGGEVRGVLVTVADITRQKESERAVREAALHDPLTGIPNRVLLLERLANALARAKRHRHHQFAVLFLDLDDLKSVNDTLGHAAGDEFLIQVAARLRACLRPEDTVARIGGDEFAILLEGMGKSADVTGVTERILSDISKPVHLQGYEAVPSASIGVVLSRQAYQRPEQLLRDADTAMYRAKSGGRGRYEIFG